MALWFTQLLTEIITRRMLWGKAQPACKADNLTAICWADCLENVGASTSHSPMGLHGLLQGQLHLLDTHGVKGFVSPHLSSIGLKISRTCKESFWSNNKKLFRRV
jgi:hypothetical protein